MDQATLKIIDRLLTLAKACPDEVQTELLAIAAEVLDAELEREQGSVAALGVRSAPAPLLKVNGNGSAHLERVSL